MKQRSINRPVAPILTGQWLRGVMYQNIIRVHGFLNKISEVVTDIGIVHTNNYFVKFGPVIPYELTPQWVIAISGPSDN